MATLQHPILGSIVGRTKNSVSQYLGLKYAALTHPLGPPELYDAASASKEVPLDGTKHGPSAPAFPNCCEAEQGLIQQKLDPHPEQQSELECLNLNVTVPAGTASGAKLPVLVFIHGGGFNLGSNSWPQHDQARIVELSSKKELPMIAVNINYRLGRFGFATSKELRDRGFLTNNGLRDQRIAFKWIKKYIAGFGGDPDRITAIGQSAGGMSGTVQLQSEEPLFEQLIAMGGNALMRPSLSLEVHEKIYEKLVTTLGLDGLDADQRIAALSKNDPELSKKLGPQFPIPFAVDNDILKHDPSHALFTGSDDKTLPGKNWCKKLYIGCCDWDVSIFTRGLLSVKDKLPSLFINTIKDAFPDQPDAVAALLSDYGISETAPTDNAVTGVLQFFQDATFEAPVTSIASGFAGKAYVYRFREGNPWPGMWQGYATHIFDVAVLWQNYREKLPAETQQVAEALAVDVIRFTNGLTPSVDRFDSPDKPVRIYGPQGKLEVKAVGEIEVGSDKIFKYKDTLGLEPLVALFGPLMGKVAAAGK